MSVNADAVLERSERRNDIRDLSNRTSNEVSDLLLRAISLVERDEVVAIDLMKKASSLLRPSGAKTSPAADQGIVVGGLAPWQAKRTKAYIAERISHSISLPELASVAKLSTSYFSAAFKATFGMPPHAYIVHQRVAFAKHLMTSSEAPLCEIALDCGLSDQAHLSRVFRKVTGMTPSAWRRYSARPLVAAASLGDQ